MRNNGALKPIEHGEHMSLKIDFMPLQMKNFLRATERREPLVKILTYNIWFNEVTGERIDSVLKIIEECDAEFVCLQEMTGTIMEHFMKNVYI